MSSVAQYYLRRGKHTHFPNNIMYFSWIRVDLKHIVTTSKGMSACMGHVG